MENVRYDPAANCWRWVSEFMIDGNTRVCFSGETLTRAMAQANLKTAVAAAQAAAAAWEQHR